jgi:hypothetical protein
MNSFDLSPVHHDLREEGVAYRLSGAAASSRRRPRPVPTCPGPPRRVLSLEQPHPLLVVMGASG